MNIICKECGKEFDFSSKEQNFYTSMNYEMPKRCPECRKARKAAKKEAEAQKKWEEAERKLSILLKSLPYQKISLGELKFENPEHSLVIIGNGFDIMHGVKSSYWDFQKTIGKNSSLRYEMETYLDVPGDLWSNLEDSLGRLNYSMFLNPTVLDMWLDDFGAYDPDAQAADFFAAVETAIGPTFNIPRELNQRFKKWIKTLRIVDSVYKLDLNRPKKSMMRKNMDNMDMKYCMKRLSTRTVLGKSQENIFRLIMDIVYKEKNIDESKMSDQEYDDFIKSAAPKVYDEIKSDIEAFDQKLQQFAKDNGIKKGKLSEGDLPDEGYSITLRELLEGKEPISNTERKKRMGQ